MIINKKNELKTVKAEDANTGVVYQWTNNRLVLKIIADNIRLLRHIKEYAANTKTFLDLQTCQIILIRDEVDLIELTDSPEINI